MGDVSELIVEFRRGVAEETAKAVITSAGAAVRRRMRTDHEDQVMLLVKVTAAQLDAVRKSIESNQDVSRTEENAGGYRPM